MPSSDDSPRTRRGGERLLTLSLLVALLAALMPVIGVVKPGGWLLGSVVIATLVLTAGYGARRLRLPAVAVSLIEAGVWVAMMTAVFLRDTALLWVIPTPETIRAVPPLFDDAMDEIILGAAPLEDTAPLAFLIVGSMGLLTIIVDHVVLTARMPLLASIGIVAVSLIPAIAVPREVDVVAFVFLAVAILFLIRAETRSRERPLERDAERTAGVPATALGIGAIAVVVTVVATPLLPQPLMRAGTGLGGGPGIDATLQLGDDLRRPEQIEVLRVRSNAPSPPYLRATTLSRFEGGVWEPDRVRTVPLDSEFGLGTVSVAEDVRLAEYTTDVEVMSLASVWLPVPYPAVEVTGLDGRWAAVPYNRTVISQSGTTQGQAYTVVSNQARPTLEQIRSYNAGGPELRDETTQVPPETPAIVTELAAEVTAGATNDYDRLIAMQRWFRGGEFRYSLEAPVEEGFDGSGAEAVAEFLERRQGYCIHFASAFALMARTLHMPTRIVIGYLPGVATTDSVDDQVVYSVSSSLLHAWPEVYFDNAGWIPFEPTAGLGVPTSFSPAASLPGDTDDPNSATPGAAPSPTPSSEQGPNGPLDPRDEALPGTPLGTANPLPMLGVVLLILFVLALPFLARELRRRQLTLAARGGDAAAAWMIVQDAAIDAGIAVPASETPRAFAQRLIDQHGADADDMYTLAVAIERASYAPAGGRDYWMGDAAMDAATAVRAQLLAAAPPARRILAVIAPRSLIVRPGSVYAGGAPATR
ncbi:transglutaminaseTgpA domain-containing protein [Microbacterium sp. NPDC056003]|uniref:transglutaminase TgpA family protein n=1 Tax=Microbacterium sp. NPDC056003 TaxID=3345676 RepID=UPI0035D6D9DE